MDANKANSTGWRCGGCRRVVKWDADNGFRHLDDTLACETAYEVPQIGNPFAHKPLRVFTGTLSVR